MKINKKKIAKKASRAISLALIIESDSAIKKGDKAKAIATTIAGAALNVVDFYDTLRSISEKEFSEMEVKKGKDDLFYLKKITDELTLMPIINSYLIASSLVSISKMK